MVKLILYTHCMLTLIGAQLLAIQPRLFVINNTTKEITLEGTSKAPITVVGSENFSLPIGVKGTVEVPNSVYLSRLDIVEKRLLRRPKLESILEDVLKPIERALKEHLDVLLTISESERSGKYDLSFKRVPSQVDVIPWELIPELSTLGAPAAAAAAPAPAA